MPITTEVDKSRFRIYDEKILRCDNSKLRSITGWTPNPEINRTTLELLNYWRRKIAVRFPEELSG